MVTSKRGARFGRLWVVTAGLLLWCALSAPSWGQCSNIGLVTASFTGTCELEATLVVNNPFGSCGNGACQGVAVSLRRDSPIGPVIGGNFLFECAGGNCCHGRPTPFVWRAPLAIPAGVPNGTHLFVSANNCQGDCTDPPPFEIVYYSSLSSPQFASASTDRCNDVVVLWAAVSGATTYRVSGRPQGAQEWADIGQTTQTSFLHSGVFSMEPWQYRVVATRSSGCVVSEPSPVATGMATGGDISNVNISGPIQPLCAFHPYTLGAHASGPGPFEYRWFRDGNLVGDDSSTYVIDASVAGSATYTCEMRNHCGTWMPSPPTSVTVLEPLRITTPPQSGTYCQFDGAVTLSVSVSGGLGVRYLWSHISPDGSFSMTSAGSSITIFTQNPDDVGRYKVIVSDECGASLEAVADIDVRICALPVDSSQGTDDNFNGPESAGPRSSLSLGSLGFLGLASNQQIGFDVLPGNGGANRRVFAHSFTALPNDVIGGTLTLRVRAGGGGGSTPQDDTIRLGFADGSPTGGIASFWSIPIGTLYGGQWNSGADGVFTLNLASLPPGGSGPVNLLGGINMNGFLDLLVEDKTGVDYASIHLDRQQVGVLPWVDVQPQSTTVCRSAQAAFSVAGNAAGAPFTYQWRKDGATMTDVVGHIAGSATPTLTITGATCSDVGDYSCVIGNCCGTATSVNATLVLCMADFNCSGVVTVQDIFDFLTGFFASDFRADVDCVAGISVQDVFDFLSLWFAGC